MYRPMTKRAGCGNPSCKKTHWNVDEARACSFFYQAKQIIQTIPPLKPSSPPSFPQLENPAALSPKLPPLAAWLPDQPRDFSGVDRSAPMEAKEPKFKVGDVVRVLSGPRAGWLGAVGQPELASEKCPICVCFCDGCTLCYTADELELVPVG